MLTRKLSVVPRQATQKMPDWQEDQPGKCLSQGKLAQLGIGEGKAEPLAQTGRRRFGSVASVRRNVTRLSFRLHIQER